MRRYSLGTIPDEGGPRDPPRIAFPADLPGGRRSTSRLNLRLCSNTIQIPSWNEEKVRVAFVLDTCDRETIRYVGTTAGISGEMIRRFMVEAMEARFVPKVHLILWNG